MVSLWNGPGLPALEILHHPTDRLRRVPPVGTNETGRAPLDPAHHVLAGPGLVAGRAQNPAVRVGDHALAFIKGDVWNRDSPISNRPKDQTNLKSLEHSGAQATGISLFIPDQTIPFQPDGADPPLLRHDFHR